MSSEPKLSLVTDNMLKIEDLCKQNVDLADITKSPFVEYARRKRTPKKTREEKIPDEKVS